MKPTVGSPRTRAAEKHSDERLTYDVPEAGRLLGLSRNGAYAAAKAGLIPVLNIGRRMLVPKAALHQMLAAGSAEWQRPSKAAVKPEADRRGGADPGEGGEARRKR